MALHGNDQFFSFGIREWGEGGRPIRLFIFFFSHPLPLRFDNAGRKELGKPSRAHQLYKSINITLASCLTVNINIESTDARLINYIIFEAKTTAGSIFLLIFLASCSSANSPGRPSTVRHQAVLIRHDGNYTQIETDDVSVCTTTDFANIILPFNSVFL